MLDKRFICASIKEITPQCFKLTVKYNYYNLYEFSDVFVYKTLAEAKDKLIVERCDNKIEIINSKGDIVPIVVSDG